MTISDGRPPERQLTMLDLNPTEGIQVQLVDGRLWVNVDGICRLRATWLLAHDGAEEIDVEVDDQRKAKP